MFVWHLPIPRSHFIAFEEPIHYRHINILKGKYHTLILFLSEVYVADSLKAEVAVLALEDDAFTHWVLDAWTFSELQRRLDVGDSQVL